MRGIASHEIIDTIARRRSSPVTGKGLHKPAESAEHRAHRRNAMEFPGKKQTTGRRDCTYRD